MPTDILNPVLMSFKGGTMKRLTLILLLIITLIACNSECTQTDGDVDNDNRPLIMPKSVKCWEHSSKKSTDLVSTNEELMELAKSCDEADSGHEDYFCHAMQLHLTDTNGTRYAVQCETAYDGFEDKYVSADVQYGWYGPDYGIVSQSLLQANTDITGIDDWSPSCTVNGSMLPEVGQVSDWTDEMIDDVLAHDILVGKTCEEITDYRTCIRSFIPPNTHCTPMFKWTEEYYEFYQEQMQPCMDGNSFDCDSCYLKDKYFWEYAEFLRCESRYEPGNQTSLE